MMKLLGIFTILAMSWGAKAQDERYFRQIFSGEVKKQDEKLESKLEDKKYFSINHSPYYALDLDRDGTPEQLVFVKKDSEDWLDVFDKDKKKIYSYKFDNLGFDSELFRIEMKSISPDATIVLLYYYEGISRYIDFQGTSRIYALTIDKNDLKTIAPFKGPSFFDEVKKFKGHYHKRNYEVFLEDFDHDKVKELVVRFRNTSNVFLYKGGGHWQTFRDSL
ncbi:MAG: hypothetical protein K2Q18_19770 [Bdellovibrionales bacterium]|nr:hypothetical protein [Bdellovibrionales bacterium]